MIHSMILVGTEMLALGTSIRAKIVSTLEKRCVPDPRLELIVSIHSQGQSRTFV